MIGGYANCPPTMCENKNIMGLRFVFSDFHPNNILPPLVINPKRVNGTRFTKESTKCSGHALSMYNSLDNARKAYAKILKVAKNLPKTAGTHIAEFPISHEDGLVTSCNDEGHFDLHEYEGVDFANRMVVICLAQ